MPNRTQLAQIFKATISHEAEVKRPVVAHPEIKNGPKKNAEKRAKNY